MMGEKLTETTREIVTRIEFDEAGVLDWRSEIFPIPWRDIEPSVFEEARLLLEKHPTPIWLDEARTCVSWDWVYAVSLVDLEKQMRHAPHFEYEIQGFRIGEAAIVSLPGEPFVEG